MLVIPAIDLKDGQCVRLKQGDFAQKTVYSVQPLEVARTFVAAGAKRLHIVDLDGAESGNSANAKIVEALLEKLEIPIQLGGGIRSLNQMEQWLANGVDAVIIGTVAVDRPEILRKALEQFGPERFILAVDAKNGKVMSAGWQKESGYSASDLALQFKRYGLQRVLYTDIAKDGMFSGPNITATKSLAQSTGLKVTASGGVGCAEDIQRLGELESLGVDSVVVGRAIYENKLSLEEAFTC